jgi:hypothetical protein
MVNEACTKKSYVILGVQDEDTQLKDFLEAAGLTTEQLYDESKIEIVPRCKK